MASVSSPNALASRELLHAGNRAVSSISFGSVRVAILLSRHLRCSATYLRVTSMEPLRNHRWRKEVQAKSLDTCCGTSSSRCRRIFAARRCSRQSTIAISRSLRTKIGRDRGTGSYAGRDGDERVSTGSASSARADIFFVLGRKTLMWTARLGEHLARSAQIAGMFQTHRKADALGPRPGEPGSSWRAIPPHAEAEGGRGILTELTEF